MSDNLTSLVSKNISQTDLFSNRMRADVIKEVIDHIKADLGEPTSVEDYFINDLYVVLFNNEHVYGPKHLKKLMSKAGYSHKYEMDERLLGKVNLAFAEYNRRVAASLETSTLASAKESRKNGHRQKSPTATTQESSISNSCSSSDDDDGDAGEKSNKDDYHIDSETNSDSNSDNSYANKKVEKTKMIKRIKTVVKKVVKKVIPISSNQSKTAKNTSSSNNKDVDTDESYEYETDSEDNL